MSEWRSRWNTIEGTRRLFDPEVNGYLLREKMEKRLAGGGSPDHSAMRAGREALVEQMVDSMPDRYITSARAPMLSWFWV